MNHGGGLAKPIRGQVGAGQRGTDLAPEIPDRVVRQALAIPLEMVLEARQAHAVDVLERQHVAVLPLEQLDHPWDGGVPQPGAPLHLLLQVAVRPGLEGHHSQDEQSATTLGTF